VRISRSPSEKIYREITRPESPSLIAFEVAVKLEINISMVRGIGNQIMPGPLGSKELKRENRIAHGASEITSAQAKEIFH
tara:strand:+ start:924 stop:1163 length:240 start_codon:yes stop_codon:yes gene_type:complete